MKILLGQLTYLRMRLHFKFLPYVFTSALTASGTQFLSIPTSAEDLITFNSIWRSPSSFKKNLVGEELSVSYGNWFADFKSFDMKWRGKIVNQSSQLHFRYLGINDIELRPNKPTSDPLGYYSSYGLSLGASTARRIGDNELGLTLKLIRMELYQYSTTGYAVDIGISRNINNNLSFTYSLLNIGSLKNLIDLEPSLPLRSIISSTYDHSFGEISLGIEKNSLVKDIIYSIGIKKNYQGLDFGLNYYNNQSFQNITSGFSIGIGIFTFNYAFLFGNQQLGTPQFLDIIIRIP